MNIQECITQLPEGVTYYFFRAPKELNLDSFHLTRLQEGIITQNGITVEISIIRQSHLLCFHLPNGQRLVEILACVNLDVVFKAQVISASELFTTRGFDFSEKKNFQYSLSAIKGKLTAETALTPSNAEIFLSHDFPTLDGYTIVPKTQIGVWTHQGGLLIKTLHGYPNDKSVIITQSILTVED